MIVQWVVSSAVINRALIRIVPICEQRPRLAMAKALIAGAICLDGRLTFI
jgi:hypothetical protein